ncbi:hypothetical protein PTTG_04323 [Puccinia triticina 1-1 BBBD Race 1]|uniref:Uncharacterized protein n=1 Tax=Puccinia triticina (isolate 1-1 / race 1 (BBBD)) TaxID=630390 RepID=A0A0C4EU44_PUCT1|nr:hypothetical protein PTTG_04323 [Puccinia triticina 1-1 BBBD Race 1]
MPPLTPSANPTTTSAHSSALALIEHTFSANPQPPTNQYPLILDIEDIVPEPFIQEIPVPHGFKLPPSTLRMVRWLDGATPSFNSYPFCFSIPGDLFLEAYDFVKAMQATIRWNLNNVFYNKGPSDGTSTTFSTTKAHPQSRNPGDPPGITSSCTTNALAAVST